MGGGDSSGDQDLRLPPRYGEYSRQGYRACLLNNAHRKVSESCSGLPAIRPGRCNGKDSPLVRGRWWFDSTSGLRAGKASGSSIWSVKPVSSGEWIETTPAHHWRVASWPKRSADNRVMEVRFFPRQPDCLGPVARRMSRRLLNARLMGSNPSRSSNCPCSSLVGGTACQAVAGEFDPRHGRHSIRVWGSG